MAQRRPNRKKIKKRFKAEKFHSLDKSVRSRTVKRKVERENKKKGYQEWKSILVVVFGMIVAMALIILIYNLTKTGDYIE